MLGHMEPGHWRFIVIILATLLLTVDSSHYRGSTISWKHLGGGEVSVDYELVWNRDSADGKTTLDLMKCDEDVIASKELSGQLVVWACLSSLCANDPLPTMQYRCTAFSEQEQYSLGGRSVKLDFDLDSVYHFGNNPTGVHKGFWISPLQNGDDLSTIRFYTEINLNPRSDNSLIDNSPKTKAIPNLLAHVGCRFHHIIPYRDPDNDRVRCRWALNKEEDDDKLDECGGLCLDRTRFNATLNEKSCELQWTPPSGGEGNYGGTVVLEDYLLTSPAAAMSEVPLQWVLKVVDRNLNCDEMPEFCCGTPLDSLCIAIPTGDTITFTVSVKPGNPSNTISRVEFSQLPEGMMISNLTDAVGSMSVKEISVSWTPSSDQKDATFFLCFMAFDNIEGFTETRCLTFVTGSESPKIAALVFPNSGDDFAPNKKDVEISFTKKVGLPTVSRYIRVLESVTDKEVEKIDTSSSTITISSDSLTASFRLQGTYTIGTQYYIVVDPGAFVGESGCSGGGIAAEGVLSKDDWTFITVFQCDTDAECNPRASCVSSTCLCDTGFSGDGTAVCVDIRECEGGLDDCHADAVCTNTVGSFQCSCPTGFSGDGKICVDINECGEGTDNCHQFADCTNTKGSFDCSCHVGFEGDGVNCEDIDECEKNTDDCEEADHEKCDNTVGSFRCLCVVGFERSGGNCVDINECERGTPCGNNADCDNIPGSFTCTCDSGYEKVGVGCVDINECERQLDNCHPVANCINEPGTFTCQCPPGLTGDGVTACDGCVDDSDCDDDARCIVLSSSNVCTCNFGFTGDGDSCSDIDECTDWTDNCADNAECINTPGSFLCSCKPGFTGDGVIECIDISNCTGDWPTQRDRWLDANDEWKNTTRKCSELGHKLPEVTFDSEDPPMQQWHSLSRDYLNELNKWLESAASLHVPGIPSSVSFDETDPDNLWKKLKEFVNDVMNKWYDHIGKPNDLERPEPSGQCDDKLVEKWVHCIVESEELQDEYEEKFNGRCDAR